MNQTHRPRNTPTKQNEVAENDSGQALLPSDTLTGELHRNDELGQKMRFWGYWVSAERDNLEVAAGEFDDTDLSDRSDWKEAWQNEDPAYAHGFLDPLTMLHDLSKKITGEIDAAELEDAAAKFREGIPWPVNDLQDLAKLIQLLIPKALPKPSNRTQSADLTDDAGGDVSF